MMGMRGRRLGLACGVAAGVLSGAAHGGDGTPGETWCLSPARPVEADVSATFSLSSLCGSGSGSIAVPMLGGSESEMGDVGAGTCDVGRVVRGSASGSALLVDAETIEAVAEVSGTAEEGPGFASVLGGAEPFVCVPTDRPAILRLTAVYRFEQGASAWSQPGVAGTLVASSSCDPAVQGAVLAEFDDVVPGVPGGVFERTIVEDVFVAGGDGVMGVLRVGAPIGFSAISLPPSTAERTFDARVELTVEVLDACPADIGSSSGPRDGEVNLQDFSIYLTRWATGDARADITTTGAGSIAAGAGRADGVIDLSDFSFYLTQWSRSSVVCGACGG